MIQPSPTSHGAGPAPGLMPPPWRMHTHLIYLIPEVETMSLSDQKRLDILIDVAHISSPRWIITASDETLRKKLRFGHVEQWLRWAAARIEEGLLLVNEAGFYRVSPRLTPFDPDVPPVPTSEESLQNLQLRLADAPQMQRAFGAIELPAERQAVRRGWMRFIELLAAEGVDVPQERADRRAFKAARIAFKSAFLGAYRSGMRPGEIAGRVASDLLPVFRAGYPFETAEDAGENTRSDADVTNSANVTNGVDSNVTPENVTPNVTEAARVTAPLLRDISSDEGETDRDNNNTGDNRSECHESGRSHETEHETENVTSPFECPAAGSDPKAVVVEILTNFGIWESEALQHVGWLNPPLAKMYVAWIQSQPVDRTQAALASHLQKRTPIPVPFQREFERQAQRERERAAEATLRKALETERRAAEAKLQAHWEGLDASA